MKAIAKSKKKNQDTRGRGSVSVDVPIGSIEERVLEKCSNGKNIRLEDLTDELSKELGYDPDRVIRTLIELQEKKKILIVEKAPYKTLTSFIFSPYSLWFWVAIAATLASFALIFVTSGLALYLRYVFGGLLVLFLPGYSLVEALYAKKKELDELTRIALSIGLSLALVPLTGLVLNYTPFGIRLIPVVISLAILTMAFLFLAVRRKHAYYKVAKGIA
jgi:hypothetical protein